MRMERFLRVAGGVVLVAGLLAGGRAWGNAVAEVGESADEGWGEVLAAMEAAEGGQQVDPFNGVVRVEVVSVVPDVFLPWRTEMEESSGSGVVVPGRRILTNAHVASGATHLTVRKQSSDDPYPAHVEFIDNDCDLALLTVEDESFFDDIEPLPWGGSPRVRMRVVVAGFPKGGEEISFTEGIVSRVELQTYVLSLRELPAAQIDAAINSGNSGGPVLDVETEELVGIAFQAMEDGDDIGYIIPMEIVEHFFADCEDGRVDGFGAAGFRCQTLENPDMRRYLEMEPGEMGVRISYVSPWLETNSVRVGDVLMAVDGVAVSDMGKVRLGDGVARNWREILYGKQVGESITYDILRGGERLTVTNRVSRDQVRVRPWLAGDRPDYFIFGGLVFTTLTMDYYSSLRTAPAGSFDAPRHEQDDIVMLSAVLNDTVNMGIRSTGWPVVKVGGQDVGTLRELAERLDGWKEPWIEIELLATLQNEDVPLWMVLDTEKARAAMPGILDRYRVPADRSGAAPEGAAAPQ